MVLEDLNERFETTYELNEVWGSTTVMNRFGYFKGHLSLIEGVIADSKSIWIDPDAFNAVAELLK